MLHKSLRIIETLVYGYSSWSTQEELSNEYQHDRVDMVFKNLSILVFRTKVASVSGGLTYDRQVVLKLYYDCDMLWKFSRIEHNIICFCSYFDYHTKSGSAWVIKLYLTLTII